MLKYERLAQHVFIRFYSRFFPFLPLPREDWEAEARAMAWEAQASGMNAKEAARFFSRAWYYVLKAWGWRKTKRGNWVRSSVPFWEEELEGRKNPGE